MVQRVQVGNASDEFVEANLGDRRRDKRLAAIVGALEADPAKGFPGALGSDAALEAFYRFINNDDFSAADIVAPHVAATLKRAASTGTVIAVHDTTNVEYGTARGDLAPTS